jgi:hypothetical protein
MLNGVDALATSLIYKSFMRKTLRGLRLMICQASIKYTHDLPPALKVFIVVRGPCSNKSEKIAVELIGLSALKDTLYRLHWQMFPGD